MNRYGQYCYTYLIGWRGFDIWYYGYRARNVVDTQTDLWLVYKTSSAHVHRFAEEHGAPDVIRVHKLFETKAEAKLYETKFLKRVKAVRSGRWLNRNDTENFQSPDKFSDKSRLKMSLAKIGTKLGPRSDETKLKISEANTGRQLPMVSEETRLKMSKTRKGHRQSTRHVRNRAKALQGKTRSPESIERIRQSHLGITHGKSMCPHCKKYGGERAMKRYHFSNCKVVTNA